MIVPTTPELSVITILDRGVPNSECIAISVLESTDLGQYGIMIGHFAPSNLALPFQDHLFWFGDGLVKAGDWIFVNTGAGEPRLSKTSDQKNDIYTVFWKKAKTVFANSNIVPILFKIDSVDVLLPPADVPHLTDSSKMSLASS